MARVFLSYDHDDDALAHPLVAAIEKAGHTVWYDRQIHGGAQFSRKIEQALDEADAVVVLWSPHSLESAWVRDEAAEGRDRNKLIPLSIGSITPPMGFRQFQTIDLGPWKGRGKVPRLAEILEAIENQASVDGTVQPSAQSTRTPPLPDRSKPSWVIPVAAVLAVAGIGYGAWTVFGGSALPVVEVTAADSGAQSQALVSDLFVKLGTLSQVGQGKWQLVDANSRKGRSDLVFRSAASKVDGHSEGTLVLLDAKTIRCSGRANSAMRRQPIQCSASKWR